MSGQGFSVSARDYYAKQSAPASCGCAAAAPAACSLASPAPYQAPCSPSPLHRGLCGDAYFAIAHAYGR